MGIAERVNAEIKAAMLGRQKGRLEALRSIKSTILLVATSGAAQTDDEVVKALMKDLKKRQDAAGIYQSSGRADLAEVEVFQASVIQEFLPAMMSEQEVDEFVAGHIAQLKSSGANLDMGKLIGEVMAKLQGKTEGRLVSAAVRKHLG